VGQDVLAASSYSQEAMKSRTASGAIGANREAQHDQPGDQAPCAALLARIEVDVFRLEQAAQLAQIAADQAVALASRKRNGK
jgi:hypothetical protein